MNECLKHQQRYPQGGWCVYCGAPVTQQAAPLTYGPYWQVGQQCGSCGGWYFGSSHYCMSTWKADQPLRVWLTNTTNYPDTTGGSQ